MSETPILTLEGVSKSFGPVTVIDGVTVHVRPGKVQVLLGENGAGKSTLIKMMSGVYQPDGGRILMGDEVLFDATDRQTHKESEIRKKRLHFGLVFQNFNLFPQYTALENVMLARELLAKEQPDWKQNKRIIRQEIEAASVELLTQMGLQDRMGNYPHQLSGGQCQRVAIARALNLEPDILCFDEPTSALDPELTGEVLRVIRELADKNTTMIIVTHEMSFARDVASKVIFMDDGGICEMGTPAQVFGDPQQERTRQFLSNYSGNL